MSLVCFFFFHFFVSFLSRFHVSSVSRQTPTSPTEWILSVIPFVFCCLTHCFFPHPLLSLSLSVSLFLFLGLIPLLLSGKNRRKLTGSIVSVSDQQDFSLIRSEIKLADTSSQFLLLLYGFIAILFTCPFFPKELDLLIR